MSLTFTGKPPVVVVPASKKPVKQPIDPQAIKGVFIAALRSAKSQQSAADCLEEATFSLVGEDLEIQTKFSAPMLQVLFNPQSRQLMMSALTERGAGNLEVKLLPALACGAESESPKSGTVSLPLLRLAESAAKLNKVSDQLTNQVEQIDAALKRLNLGVSAWVTISENEDEDGNWSQEQLGYVRIGSRWGVALRSRTAMRGDPSAPDETFSGFADAPRQLRIRAVEHIPKLLDELSAEAEGMIAKLSPKVDEISELTLAFNSYGNVPAKEVKK